MARTSKISLSFSLALYCVFSAHTFHRTLSRAAAKLGADKMGRWRLRASVTGP